MAATSCMTGQQRISTLDVLWAFYLSQPKQVRKAFRSRIENQESLHSIKDGDTILWKEDLRGIRSLRDNWDKEGAPRVNRKAIGNAQMIVSLLEKEVASKIRLYPTHLGAVLMKYETEKGRVKCEIGDAQMSYFLKRPGLTTEHRSFEDINDESLNELKFFFNQYFLMEQNQNYSDTQVNLSERLARIVLAPKDIDATTGYPKDSFISLDDTGTGPRHDDF